MKRTSPCKQCGTSFTYEFNPGRQKRAKTVCPKCQETNDRKYEQARQARERSVGWRANTTVMKSAELNSLPAVAAALGVSQAVLRKMEQRVLAKIRKHPDLRKLWLQCREEGIPPQEDWGDRILDYQLELGEFYAVRETLSGHGCAAEALECEREIRKCQSLLARALGMNAED